jgi:hypothetical protein
MDDIRGVIPDNLDEDALARLGRFGRPVQHFVRKVNRIHWMERAGKPEPWDAKVLRVWNIAEAKKEKAAFRPIYNAVWDNLEGLGRVANRFDQMQAAEDYWIARFNPIYDRQEPSITHDILFPEIHSDIVGALREVVLDDLVSLRFFRANVRCYERGHWCPGVTPEGLKIVF